MPQILFELSIARPPNARERLALQKRRQRLLAMEQSVVDANFHVTSLVVNRSSPAGDFRLRDGFVRRHTPHREADTFDRNVIERLHRPPATRSMSPRGRAISFELLAMLEAQMRLAPGQATPTNQMRLKAENDGHDGWTNYIATDAVDALGGRIYATVRSKKVRQIQSSLQRLADENLVRLPQGTGPDRGRRYDEFQLMREDARPTGDNDVYRVPDAEGSYFEVPLTLFTNGWIHVLEDSELVLLLIAARMRARSGDRAQPLTSGPRKLHYGLSRDSFEAAHRMLGYLGVLTVISDYQRNFDGTVDGFSDRGAKPHLLRFHPEALDQPAHSWLVDTIATQITASGAG